jgi:hypothetical protein
MYPLRPTSLEDFVARSDQLCLPVRPLPSDGMSVDGSEVSNSNTFVPSDESIIRHMHYTISGRDEERGQTVQIATLGPNALTPGMAGLMRVRRDWDSVLGTSTDLPYDCSLHVYPIPAFDLELNKPIHIPHYRFPLGFPGATVRFP